MNSNFLVRFHVIAGLKPNSSPSSIYSAPTINVCTSRDHIRSFTDFTFEWKFIAKPTSLYSDGYTEHVVMPIKQHSGPHFPFSNGKKIGWLLRTFLCIWYYWSRHVTKMHSTKINLLLSVMCWIQKWSRFTGLYPCVDYSAGFKTINHAHFIPIFYTKSIRHVSLTHQRACYTDSRIRQWVKPLHCTCR